METRHNTLLHMLTSDRNRFIDSLVQMNSSDSRYQRRLDRMDSLDKYDELKKSGNLPIFCKIYENLRIKENERLKGDISSDPVYSFLLEVKDKLEQIVDEQYEQNPDSELVDSGGQDWDMYIGSKSGFLANLISSIRNRSGREELACNWSDSAKINTSDRYGYLAGLANLKGEERTDAIKNLVKEFPSYPWETFYWPNEK